MREGRERKTRTSSDGAVLGVQHAEEPFPGFRAHRHHGHGATRWEMGSKQPAERPRGTGDFLREDSQRGSKWPEEGEGSDDRSAGTSKLLESSNGRRKPRNAAVEMRRPPPRSSARAEGSPGRRDPRPRRDTGAQAGGSPQVPLPWGR